MTAPTYAAHDSLPWFVLEGPTLRGGLNRARRRVADRIDPPPTGAKFESGSCGHIAKRCECDMAADRAQGHI